MNYITHRMPRCRHSARILAAAALAALPVLSSTAQAVDASAPAILQIFESSYKNLEKRSADIFMAGYGGVWIPPTGRATNGNLSVGYDPYDRFDLGSAGNYTLYGSELGLKTAVNELHKINSNVYLDAVWNHNGTSDQNTPGFANAGGYPGFAMSNGGDQWGDFHAPGDSGQFAGRIPGIGVIDIAQEKNHQFIRNPVPGFGNNLPAGTTPQNGRLANVATEANRRFYPDMQGTSTTVNGVTYYHWNSANPSTGDPASENATGYLMRNTRWLVEEIGVDGFRLDATKHVIDPSNGNPDWVLEFYDVATNAGTKTPYLDGSRKRVFGFGEYFDSNVGVVQTSIKKDANANRDALDFAKHYAIKDNLSGNGLQNSWFNVVNNSQDSGDGYANDGSQGVAFDRSHDDGGAHLVHVANAYLMMRPGNAVIYFNAEEFGQNREFPKDGNGDALGGLYGNALTKLVDIRNSHGRGNYHERWIEKETLIFEREDSLVAGYSNRVDNGFDARTVNTEFDSGTHLIELTGNAQNATVDPNNNIPDEVIVNASGQITIAVPRNKNVNGVEHNKGFVIYGPATPRGTLGVTNVARTIAAETPTAATNGTARLTAIDVVQSDNFEVQLQTIAVILPSGFNDLQAGGDNAVLRFDGGLDINNNGSVDFTSPGGSAYGFDNFVTEKNPRWTGGNGLYRQVIDATDLSEGYHYITSRAYRYRPVAGTPLWTDFKKVIYVDRVRTTSSIDDMITIGGQSEDRDVIIESDDKTASRVHLFANTGSSQYTVDQLVSMAWSGQNTAGEYDRDKFKYGLLDIKNGNQAFTVVSFEPSFDSSLGFAGGGVNVQRIVVPFTGGLGMGLGDLTWNGVLAPDDQTQFLTLLGGNSSPTNPNTSFNPAADLNADGTITEADNVLMVPWLVFKGASAATINTATSNRLTRAIVGTGTLDIPAGSLNVSGTTVAGVPLTFTTNFNITTGKTLTKTGGEALNLNGTQNHGAGAVLVTAGGTTNFNTNAGGTNQNLNVTTTGAGSVTNFGVTQRLNSITVENGGLATVTTASAATVNGGKVLNTRGITATTGKLDLRNNNAAINYTGASAVGDWDGDEYTGATGLVATARGDGSWNGATGITSSAAATQGVLTMLGIGEASDVLQISGAQTNTWYGQTVDASTALIKYTWGGDADLNGELNGDDYFAIDSNVLNTGVVFGFSKGDFDLNGEINGDDYFILDSNITFASGQVMAGMATALPSSGGAFAAVPEPAGLGLLVGAALFANTRRRRHNSRMSER